MSSLADLARAAKRYQSKAKRSHSSAGSDGSSSSGYRSILGDDDDDDEPLDPDEPPQQPSSNLQSSSMTPASYDGEHPRLDISNKGMKLLIKMGWTQGSGLGASNNGRKDPIPTPAQTPLLGLGKATQDAYMLSNAISKPKELESLVIARETEQGRAEREEKVKVVQMREEEREDRLKTFHCPICDKGYTTISQFEEHERSYAHHHARRALEAKQARKAGKPSAEARLEKERKREAKELERMARAAGMTVERAPQPAAVKVLPKPESASSTASGGGSGFRKVGTWAPIAPPSAPGPPQRPAGGSFVSAHTTTEEGPVASASKFKAGFVPISTTSSHASPSGFRPIRAAPDPPESRNLSGRAPAFVASSLASATSQPASTQTPFHKPVECAPAPTSKFAQIAARLAAQRAAGVLGPKKSVAKVEQTDDGDLDLERMLDEGM